MSTSLGLIRAGPGKGARGLGSGFRGLTSEALCWGSIVSGGRGVDSDCEATDGTATAAAAAAAAAATAGGWVCDSG